MISGCDRSHRLPILTRCVRRLVMNIRLIQFVWIRICMGSWWLRRLQDLIDCAPVIDVCHAMVAGDAIVIGGGAAVLVAGPV